MSEENKRFQFRVFFGGMALAFVLGIAALIPVGLFLVRVLPDFGMLGLVEWIYIVPMAWYFKRRGDNELAAGLLAGAGIVFLINSACFGPFWDPLPYTS